MPRANPLLQPGEEGGREKCGPGPSPLHKQEHSNLLYGTQCPSGWRKEAEWYFYSRAAAWGLGKTSGHNVPGVFNSFPALWEKGSLLRFIQSGEHRFKPLISSAESELQAGVSSSVVLFTKGSCRHVWAAGSPRPSVHFAINGCRENRRSCYHTYHPCPGRLSWSVSVLAHGYADSPHPSANTTTAPAHGPSWASRASSSLQSNAQSPAGAGAVQQAQALSAH